MWSLTWFTSFSLFGFAFFGVYLFFFRGSKKVWRGEVDAKRDEKKKVCGDENSKEFQHVKLTSTQQKPSAIINLIKSYHKHPLNARLIVSSFLSFVPADFFYFIWRFYPIHAELLSGSTRFFFLLQQIHTTRSLTSVTKAKSKLNFKKIWRKNTVKRGWGRIWEKFVVHHIPKSTKKLCFFSYLTSRRTFFRVEMCRYHLVIKAGGKKVPFWMFFFMRWIF